MSSPNPAPTETLKAVARPALVDLIGAAAACELLGAEIDRTTEVEARKALVREYRICRAFRDGEAGVR
jgi:hypothetical protein